MMPHNWLYYFSKIACMGKIWFSVYGPKCSPPITLQDFLNFNISKNYLRYKVYFLYLVRYPWNLYLNHVIFAGFGQACLGMPIVLQDNKLQISVGKVELFCLFVTCCYTSMEATVLSCRFS